MGSDTNIMLWKGIYSIQMIFAYLMFCTVRNKAKEGNVAKIYYKWKIHDPKYNQVIVVITISGKYIIVY